MIDLLKMVLCIAFLLYSCHTDLRERMVPNELWGVVFAATLPLVIADALAEGASYLLHTAISVVSVYAFVYVLFRLNAFGGADAKALIALAFIFPAFPDLGVIGSGCELPLMGVPPVNIFAFSVLVNAVLLTVVVPLGLLAYNLCTLAIPEIVERPWYLPVGYRCEITDLRGRHVRLIEEYLCEGGGGGGGDGEGDGEWDGEGVVVRRRFSKGGDNIDDSAIKRLERLASEGLIESRVWVTPGLPFMIPITLGFVSAAVYGDLMFQGVMLFLM